MNQNDIENMAQGFPPLSIGKDHEEVVIELAKHALDLQQKLDAVLAKGMELCDEAAHVYAEYNKEMAPDVVCDGQTIQEFHDLANGRSSVNAYLSAVRDSFVDEAIHALAASGAQSFGDCMVALNQLRAETHTQDESLAGGK